MANKTAETKIPIKLKMAYDTIAKMEAKIDRYEAALREICELTTNFSKQGKEIASNALKITE